MGTHQTRSEPPAPAPARSTSTGTTRADRDVPGRARSTGSTRDRFLWLTRTRHVARANARRLNDASSGRHASVNAACASCFPAARNVSARCGINNTSCGFPSASTMDASNGGMKMMPTTINVQNHDGRQHGPAQQQERRSAPRGRGCAEGCRRSSSATAPRADCARRCRRRPGTRGSSHAAICQSPRIQRCRRLTSAL